MKTLTRLGLTGITAFMAFFSVSYSAHAALLYLTPASGTFQPGETAVLDLRIDPQGQSINAAQIDIGFPKNIVKAADVSRGNSIFSLWVSPPVINQDFGLIQLAGGIPGGYNGRAAGDPSLTNIIAQFIFEVPNSSTVPAQAMISILDSSKVLLNDGLGTPAKLTLQGANLSINYTGQPQGNAWTDILKGDKTPPEEFAVEVHQDTSGAVFGGKYFAVFSTVDKQSGLDHYEISETKDANAASSTWQWKPANSPYVLQDQSLQSTIRVKAIDKAGNVRIETVAPGKQQKKNYLFWLWFVGLAPLMLATLVKVIQFIPW